MSGYVDLHVHTNHSDGSDDPARVVERALEAGLDAIAITDHDTISGIAEAQAAASGHSLEVFPGTEVSSVFERREVHILGLGIDITAPGLLEPLAHLRDARATRAERMVEKLNALGVPVTMEGLLARAGEAAIGRMHVAQEILSLGFSRTVQDSFDKYIKAGKPAYVGKENLEAEAAIEAIHAGGGLAFVAHPGIGDQHKRLDRLFALPFDGIEAYHSRHKPDQRKAFLEFAESRGLLVTGGSDCHGDIKGQRPLLGTAKVPRAVYDTLREALQS